MNKQAEEREALITKAADFAKDFGISYDKIKISSHGEYISFRTDTGGSGGWTEGTPAVQVLTRVINRYESIKAHAQAEKERAVRALELENEMLQGQLDNLDNWFIKHHNDSLLDFMAYHVSSFVYDKRLAELQKGDSDG